MTARAAGSAVVAIVIVLAGTRSAFAEVCDKVAEWWTPAHGPIWLLSSPLSIVWFCICVAGLILVRVFVLPRWIAYAAALLFGLVSALVVLDLVEQHHVWRSAVLEGCRSFPTDLADAAAYGALGLSYLALGLWLSKRAPEGTHVETR